MPNTVIRVEGISKRYRIGEREMYPTLREGITRSITRLFRTSFAERETSHSEDHGSVLWALKDISFEVNQGEVLGVIGRNGAGKSTLFKILSRVVRPTSGFAEIQGRVGSLLEVGTGFHPELTGRENVFLNGAVLGMKRAEIIKRFDEIVAFSEIEQFLDTPVKHYSSGMYVRLAFSIAAHMDAEILIIDEALSVGDAPFQNKCIRKMRSLIQQGNTVLFVSHDMGSIQKLCSRSLLLNKGVLMLDDSVENVIRYYSESIA